MATDRKRNREEERFLSRMIDSLEEMEIEFMLLKRTKDIVPPGWGGLDVTAPCQPKKKKMTIRLDADVLDWYRGLGLGYQGRINRVLKAYMESVISKHIEGRNDRDWRGRPI